VKDPITGERDGGILFGDFGYSRTASQDVIDIVKNRFPNTVDLALWTVYPMLSVGIWLGVKAAVNQNKFIDQAARVYSIIGTSFPTFVFGLLLLMLLYAGPQIFLPGKMSDWVSQLIFSGEFKQYTHLLSIDALLNLRFDVFWDALRHMIIANPHFVLHQLGNLCACDALFHVGDAAHGLCDHRARQRSERKHRYQSTRPTKCYAANRNHGWLEHCWSAGRCCYHGNGFQLPWNR